MNIENINVEISKKHLRINDKLAVGILFSGGVESTALIMHAFNEGYSPFCISAKMDPNHRMHEHNLTSICDKLEVPLEVLDLRGVIIDGFGWPKSQHPWWGIAGSIAAVSMPNLTYMWVGANSGLRRVNDDGYDASLTYAPSIETINQASRIVKGRLATLMPLSRLTKVEQYEMIPDDVKPHLVTCEKMKSIEHLGLTSCGICKKCIELQAITDNDAYDEYCFENRKR